MKWNKNAASQKGRVFRSGLLSTAMLAAVLVLAVLLNLLVRAIPAKYTEFDLSEAVFMDGCVLQVRLAHPQLSIIGRFRRLSLYCF
mgnify:CR=1 FL=1